MPNPLASLWDDLPEAPKPAVSKVQPKPKPKPDHSEAKAIYAAYLVKAAELKRHQDYAIKVAKATEGGGMTPVMPLATMGCNGGALLCDHCRKPMILESNPYYNVPVDVAWARNPVPWNSYIKGGMMVCIVDNGTLRIYHGYDGMPKHCCTIARNAMAEAESAFVRDTSKCNIIVKFLQDEFPDKVDELLTGIMSVMFSFDPGIGVNQP